MLRGRRIVIGVTGGIAAYKTCELVRRCIKAGAQVRVVMTAHATEFVRPLTFESLSGSAVVTDMFACHTGTATEHIALARWGELIVVAPATANILAKTAHGIADDFLSTLLISTYGPVLFVPAMNTAMLKAPATQRNIALLTEMGYVVTSTGSGGLADGEVGEGRMLEPAEIVHHIVRVLPKVGPLKGRRVMVSAGPTPEPVDPVRVITNRSSGKMGVALAEVAAGMGADVTFIHGPLGVPLPAGAEAIPVQTAAEMCRAVLAHLPSIDALAMAAAVADYRPANVSEAKIKKGAERLTLDLVRTRDILREVARKKDRQVVVGFALETDPAKANERARDRIKTKSLDLVVLNLVGAEGSPFGADTNRVTFFWPDGRDEALPAMDKRDVARQVWERVVPLIEEKKKGVKRPGRGGAHDGTRTGPA